MNEVVFDRAGPQDYDDVLDFIEFIFSHTREPHHFLDMLPKLYKQEYFMDGIHYLAREGEKIKAVVGAFPVKMEFPGGALLNGRGIGMVSVHPRARSRGYMKTLMNMALKDMRNDGMAFSCLGGQRQRYEYFGYAPAGTNYFFFVREPNIRHTLGRDWKTGLSLRTVTPEDTAILDSIQALHQSKPVKTYRNRERLFDILSSWECKIFALYDDSKTGSGEFEGYLVCQPGSFDVGEINLKNPSRMCEALGLLLRYKKEHGSNDGVEVTAGPQDIEKLALLSRFSENCRQSTVYQFNIFDFRTFAEPFLKFRAEQQNIADGTFVLRIAGDPAATLEISVHEGNAEIRESISSPDLILNHLDAVRFLFAPNAAITFPAVRQKAFLQSLLPLPLFYESADCV